MGRDDNWEALLKNDPAYEAWYQTTLEQQEQEELDQDGEKETKA